MNAILNLGLISTESDRNPSSPLYCIVLTIFCCPNYVLDDIVACLLGETNGPADCAADDERDTSRGASKQRLI